MLRRTERGSITPFILGLTMIALVLIAGTIGVTSVQLTRMHLLDVADGAALHAANALDPGVYDSGVGESVPLSNASVRSSASEYLAAVPMPSRVVQWRLDPATGTFDGRTATISLTARAEVPLIGSVLDDLGYFVTIHVTSQARADVLVP